VGSRNKSAVVVALLVVTLLCGAFSTHEIDIIKWGYSGNWLAHENVSPDGTKNYQSKVNAARSAIELRPTLGILPTSDASSEFVIYQKDGTSWRRMNWSAMVSAIPGPHYRFGSEFGGSAGHIPMVFAFEVPIGEPAQLPLQLVPDGGAPIYVTDRSRMVLDNNSLPNRGTGVWIVFEDETGQWAFDRVEVGAPDSAGSGYRQLRIKN
jgi:hypothetical protein